jgi:hypothetical protein
MAEEKTILIHPVSKREFEFGAEHADRILNLGHGWKRKKETATKGKKTKTSASAKRDSGDTRQQAQQDDDCGCNKA